MALRNSIERELRGSVLLATKLTAGMEGEEEEGGGGEEEDEEEEEEEEEE